MLEHADVGLDNWTGLILSYLCQTEYIQIRPDRVRPMQGSHSQTCQSISSSSVGGGVLIMAEAEAKAPSWVEAEAMEERLSMIKEKIRLLSMTMNNEDFSGMSEAERAAKQAKGNEERLALFHEYTRLNSLKKAPDFSGMTEAERAAEAERRRQRDLQEARRLLAEGHPMGPRREALAHILDFDPKQRGFYYNRCSFVDIPTFDLDEECKSPFTSILHFYC